MDYPDHLLAEQLRPSWLRSSQQLPRLWQHLRPRRLELRRALDLRLAALGPRPTARLSGHVVHVEGRGRALRGPERPRGAVALSEEPWGLVERRGHEAV